MPKIRIALTKFSHMQVLKTRVDNTIKTLLLLSIWLTVV